MKRYGEGLVSTLIKWVYLIGQSMNNSNLDIISNVEMRMTLSGVSAKEKKEKALQALERVCTVHLHQV